MKEYTFRVSKDLSKERYNTYAKSCNSILYKNSNSVTYIGSIVGIVCL